MSAAPELTSEFGTLALLPDRPERHDPSRLATVTALRPPPSDPAARLTSRGIAVVAVVAALLCGAMLWWAAASAPGPTQPPSVPARIIVHSGDTLWSIAGRIAPQADPAAEVDTLVRLNHLSGVALSVGQTLRTR